MRKGAETMCGSFLLSGLMFCMQNEEGMTLLFAK